MTMDRELRSSKRQRVGPTSIEVSAVHSDSPDEVTGDRMSDYKTQKNVLNMDDANRGDNDGNKISLDDSEDNRRQVCGILGGNQSDATNGVMHTSKKTGRPKGSNDVSKDLFPEHNEKLASTLLSLKETDVPAPKHESLPKAGNNHSLDSDASAATNHCIDAETCNEKSYDVHEMHQIEMELLQKLKRYINAHGGTIGDGWRVHATKRNKIIYKAYLSPDGRRFRSMKEIARFVGILPKRKHPTGIEEVLDNTKLKTKDASGSGCLNTNVTQSQKITENLKADQLPRESVDMGKVSGRQQEISVPHVVVENKTKQERLLLKADMEPSSGFLTLGLKETNTPGIAKASRGANSTKKRQHMHWTELLEVVLKTSIMRAGGIRNQILKVLASEPPEWVKQKLQPSITTDVLDTSRLKDIVSAVLAQYRGEEACGKRLGKETFYEKLVNVREMGKTDEGIIETGSGRKNFGMKEFPSSEVMTEHCRNVLQDITSKEKFAQLFNLIHGSFAGSRTHDVFDFRLIELRMSAGTYGMSPALFDSDIQQIWKRVREIGQEMTLLADSLADYSHASYKNQVSTLLQGEPHVNPTDGHTDATVRECVNGVAIEKDILDKPPETIDHCHSSKQNSKMTEIPRVEADDYSRKVDGVGLEFKDTPENGHFSSKKTISMGNTESCINGHLEHKLDGLPNRDVGSSVNQVQCKSCRSNECNDCIIVCNKCADAYHIDCLSPPLEAIPKTSWYCSCCSADRNKSSEVHPLCDGKDRAVKEGINNDVQDCLVSDQQVGLMEMHNAQENGKLDTSREQVESESNMKGFEPHIHSKVIGAQKDGEDTGFHINEEETVVHESRQESELHNDKPVDAKLCKICMNGTRDDDHLIQCSNENCLYKFYHLRCLRPPLASVPPPTWFCPSCLCRTCFMDENDAYIILCDGCDDAHHMYCLKPPLASIPENNWYCPSCLEKQKRKKGKRVLHSTASAKKSTRRMPSKKASQLQNQASLHMDRTADLSERTVGSVGDVGSKIFSQVLSPSSLYVQRGPHGLSDKIVKCEMDSSVQHEQSLKASQLANCLPDEAGETPSDGSLDGVTEKFIVRVRPRHATKHKADSELKDAGKRKRKCSEPRRSEV